MFLAALVVLGLLLLIPACGGGGGSGGNHDPGTPMGTSTVSVTATSGTLSHNTTFQLVVQ
jgi:ABC-type glycerol-3-phosphate transport system substrate-binding protein